MPKLTIERDAHPYYVNFQTNHPFTGEIVMQGDVVLIPDGFFTERHRKDGVFVRVADETPENIAPRETGDRIGITITEAEFEARQRMGAPDGKLPDSVLETMVGAANPGQRSL